MGSRAGQLLDAGAVAHRHSWAAQPPRSTKFGRRGCLLVVADVNAGRRDGIHRRSAERPVNSPFALLTCHIGGLRCGDG
jgi:hypothetical protein